jgi:hypothetical protein
MIRLASHERIQGHVIAANRLMSQGLADEQIIARVSDEPSDERERGWLRQAQIQASWSRAVAHVQGGEARTADDFYAAAPRTVDQMWIKAIAAVCPRNCQEELQ